MKTLQLLVLVLGSLPGISGTLFASSDSLPPPHLTSWISACSESYRSDSFGRGAESAIRGGDLRPRLFDENCYLLGFSHARTTLQDSGDLSGCGKEFEEGYHQGLEASALAAGLACYVLGYQAGRAALNVAAREGDFFLAGRLCVKLYQQGTADFRAQLPAVSPESDIKLTSCYLLGYFDGPLFSRQ